MNFQVLCTFQDCAFFIKYQNQLRCLAPFKSFIWIFLIFYMLKPHVCVIHCEKLKTFHHLFFILLIFQDNPVTEISSLQDGDNYIDGSRHVTHTYQIFIHIYTILLHESMINTSEMII